MAKEGTTRNASSTQETSVAKALNGRTTPNSGAGFWKKGDVHKDSASLLIECKTAMTDKESFSIRKEWLKTAKENAYSNRLRNFCLAFSFGPSSENYYVIDEKTMRFLAEKLEEEEKENN